MRARGALPVYCRILLAAVAGFLLVQPCMAAERYADFRAHIEYKDGERAAARSGAAMASHRHARLDVRLGKAGDFTLLVDMEARKMRVLSQRLKAYVEADVQGDPRSWRDLLQSASAVLMPQSLGLVSLDLKEREELGRESAQGYTASRSRNVFTLGFMGSYRDISVTVWENDAFAPFPLKAEVAEDKRTRGGSVFLTEIVSVREKEELFLVPHDFTCYTSVMDLLLFAITAF